MCNLLVSVVEKLTFLARFINFENLILKKIIIEFVFDFFGKVRCFNCEFQNTIIAINFFVFFLILDVKLHPGKNIKNLGSENARRREIRRFLAA